MITIYSIKDSCAQNDAVDCETKQSTIDSSHLSYEEINKEIQSNLKVFESVKWEKREAENVGK